MTHFIRLTAINDDPLHLRAAAIIAIQPVSSRRNRDDFEATDVTLVSGRIVRVSEWPDAIFNLINGDDA